MFDDSLRAPLLRFIRQRVRDPEAAEDLVQEVLLKVWSGLETLRDSERLVPFAYRVARNTVIDYQRARRAFEPIDESELQASPPAEDDNNNALVGAWLRGFILLLPEEKRTALWLADVEGLKQREVADRLGMTLSGAKSRIQRGRAELRALLEACCEVETDSRGNAVEWRHRAECCQDG